jgi:hypothetical protein
MTLILTLLRHDHIIFASDRRCVQGHEDARYINDDCWKTEAILNNSAMLGFAGHDIVEQVVEPLKRNGDLETGTMSDVAYKITSAAQDSLRGYPPARYPYAEFLIAGFSLEKGRRLPTALIMKPDNAFVPKIHVFNPELRHNDYFLIGKHRHGALYVFRKCAREMVTIDAGVKLACFALAEVGRYETSVGGLPQVCIIRPGQPIEDRSDHLQEEMKWVAEKSEKIREIITSIQ